MTASGVALRAAASLRSFDGTATNLANPGDNLGGYRKEAVSLAASLAESGWDVLASARFNGDYLEQPAASSLTASDYNCGSRDPQSGEWTYFCGDAPRTNRYDISPGELAFGMRVLAEPDGRAAVRELGERIGRLSAPPGRALDFEKERALRLLSRG